jgi:hypothetical protein
MKRDLRPNGVGAAAEVVRVAVVEADTAADAEATGAVVDGVAVAGVEAIAETVVIAGSGLKQGSQVFLFLNTSVVSSRSVWIISFSRLPLTDSSSSLVWYGFTGFSESFAVPSNTTAVTGCDCRQEVGDSVAGRGLRNKTANDVFETMKEETIQGWEDCEVYQ